MNTIISMNHAIGEKELESRQPSNIEKLATKIGISQILTAVGQDRANKSIGEEVAVDAFLLAVEICLKDPEHIATVDLRTPEQADLDQWQAETMVTRESDRPI